MYYEYNTCILDDTTKFIQLHRDKACKQLCTADVFAVSYSDVLVFKHSWHSHVCHVVFYGAVAMFATSCVAAHKHGEAKSWPEKIKTTCMWWFEEIKHNRHSNAHWRFWIGMLGLFAALKVCFHANGTASLSVEWDRKLAERDRWCCETHQEWCQDMWQQHWISESAKHDVLANLDIRNPATLAPVVTEGLTQVAGALGAYSVNTLNYHVRQDQLHKQLQLAETHNKVTQTIWMGNLWVQVGICVCILILFLLNSQGAAEALYACGAAICMLNGTPVLHQPFPRRLQQDPARPELDRHPLDLLAWQEPARHPPDLLDLYRHAPPQITWLGVGNRSDGGDASQHRVDASRKSTDSRASNTMQIDDQMKLVAEQTELAKKQHELKMGVLGLKSKKLRYERLEGQVAQDYDKALQDPSTIPPEKPKHVTHTSKKRKTADGAKPAGGGSKPKMPANGWGCATTGCTKINTRRTKKFCRPCEQKRAQQPAEAGKRSSPEDSDASGQSDSDSD